MLGDGSFAGRANRFACDKATGARLRRRRQGHAPLLVATLSGHPTVTAADLFFVA